MKNKKLIRLICALLSVLMMVGACFGEQRLSDKVGIDDRRLA